MKMQSNQRNNRNSRSGWRHAFTLVEMLVALLLTAVVLSAAGRITVAVMRTEAAVSQETHDTLRRSIVMDSLVSDWNGRFGGPTSVEAFLDASHRPTIRLLTREQLAGHDRITVEEPARVTYRIEVAGDSDLFILVRDADLLIGHDAVRSEVVGCGLESFSIELFREEQWHPLEPIGKSVGKPIDALRVAIQWASGDVQSRIFRLDDTAP